ncbi:indole-3-glycerol phosphate synthase TrpC [Biomaibacter acetigenes]|jgi:indole-3-glycerol phosphate synthase|uniref:Indole-3-glycerol phosphate synthase n=1 Tax=Biomaibacter acetigenes TaxID=2316383 RepID=A0A3G2R9F1_9FIRM|nr:indole-3-glycerol phosphate synthase TrpC [Biomaibacter acetigenes]AYO32043.1 indole-3-glycerol phosphate synthase TrpC [Biomaibacter acetigenes]RKL62839.1 indole-3-glycerol phosphate synthase TrpC [Thermoanaerobacteraceae bacterium SP2]
MILDEIIAYKERQLKDEMEKKPLSALEDEIKDMGLPRSLEKALTGKKGIKIIAEIKKASPSRGVIKPDLDPAFTAVQYEKGGTDAISVLTEKKFFLGDDSFLKIVKDIASCPVLRKDFIIHEYQIYQAKALGADALLLIVAVLGEKIGYFYKKAQSLGLDCLVEVHDERELDAALDAGARIIGINNRNLKDFSVDLKTCERLIGRIPEGIIKISESGIKTANDVRYLKSIGVDGILVGETLMKSKDVCRDLAAFKEA